MKTPKDKHMRFEDRLRIQEMLDQGCSFTQTGKAGIREIFIFISCLFGIVSV